MLSDYREMFTHDFRIHFDEETGDILVHWLDKDGHCPRPIRISFETLLSAGSEGASRFLGERVLLLIPRARRELFGIDDNAETDQG
jgi:hypothetical protein